MEPSIKNCLLALLLVLSVFLVDETFAAVSREQMEKMGNGFRKTCVGKVGADLALVSQIRDGTFVEEPASKCYTKCIMGLLKTITKQGEIDIEMLVKQVGIMADPSIAGTMIDGARKCYAETKADDPCELAWLFTKCIYASDPSTFFFP